MDGGCLSIVEFKSSYCNFEWDECYSLAWASSVFLVVVILNGMNIYVTFVELSCASCSNHISG